jgi:predicted ATPase/DNA-binding winged helix-turn-helix (wHTH) protein
MGGRTSAENRPQAAIAFGSYRFLPRKRILLRGNDEVRLGSRAIDILGILLERAGEIVSSAEIMSRVWKDTRVEGATLKVHIGLLRKALGELGGRSEFIENVAGRGYRFLAPVQRLVDRTANADEDRADGAASRANRVIGRQNALEELATLLAKERLVTISGAAGIGKTTIARVIADRSRKTGLPTHFIDLAPLSGVASVVSALASILDLPARRHRRSEIATFLSDQHALLVFDNCEHVLSEVSQLADELLARAPNIRILATSRERLQMLGEHVYHLGALDLPRPADSLSARVAVTYSAIELFVDRASSVVDTFELSDGNVRTVVEICRRVDGIPLVIELAAGQVAMFGLTEIARGLNNSLETLALEKRTPISRHRTLGEALDWSYRLLSPLERAVLRRLSIFPGKFDHSAAVAVCSEGEVGSAAILASVASLVRKSLIIVDGDDGRLRLPETARAHAGAKLRESSEFRQVAKLHATYCCNLFVDAEYNWEERAPDEWHAKYGIHIDDVRSALTWAFSDAGEGALGIELAASSAVLWLQLSLLDEYISLSERGLAASPENVGSKRHQLQLVAALGYALLHAKGPTLQSAQAFEKTLALSNELGISDHRARASWGICAQKIVSGDYSGALARIEAFLESSGDSESLASRLVSERMKAAALHLRGDSPSGRRLLEEVLAQPTKSTRRGIDSAFYVDNRVAATAYLSGALWIEGFPGRAIQAAEESVDEALSIGHMPSLCQTLSIAACSTLLLAGDNERASTLTDLLLTKSREHHLEYWNLWGKSYATVLAHRSGSAVGLRDVPYLRMETNWAGPLREVIATVCPSICDPRLFSEAEQQSGWCRPELLRGRGELLRSQPSADAKRSAEAAFLLSQKLACESGALSWEIRTAISLAKLWMASRRLDAKNVIEDVLGRFVDPYPTTDMFTARRLYEELR